jgi:DNA-binding NtrC family response regulator
MGGAIRVLVVDEDEDVLELTETFLERESDTITALPERSARAAATRVETDDIDCVVSDYRMPEMDGLELYDAVADYDDDLPFFLLTASAGNETATKADQVGVTGFIQKGAGTDHYADLARRIEAAVDG